MRMARPGNKNTPKYWWDRHISGLSLMHADFTTHDFATHTHDAFVIAVTELGGARFKSRGVTDSLRPSALFVSNPEEPQSSWMGDSPRLRYRSMYLTQAAIDVVADGLGISSVPYFTSNTFFGCSPCAQLCLAASGARSGHRSFSRARTSDLRLRRSVRPARQRGGSHRGPPPRPG